MFRGRIVTKVYNHESKISKFIKKLLNIVVIIMQAND